MKVARSLLVMASLGGMALSVMAGAIDGTGLHWPQGDSDHWKRRLSLTSPAAGPWNSAPAAGRAGRPRVDSATVVADYYFAAPMADGMTRGFRASGGIGFARRGTPWLGRLPLGASVSNSTSSPSDTDSAASTFPYLGVGYSGIYPKSGWGFTADVGLIGGTTPRADAGSPVALDGYGMRVGADSPIAQMRMRPIFQVGVSYSF